MDGWKISQRIHQGTSSRKHIYCGIYQKIWLSPLTGRTDCSLHEPEISFNELSLGDLSVAVNIKTIKYLLCSHPGAQTSKQLPRLDTSYQENWPADREVHLRLLLHPLNVVHGGHDVSHLLQVDAAAVVYVPHPQRVECKSRTLSVRSHLKDHSSLCLSSVHCAISRAIRNSLKSRKLLPSESKIRKMWSQKLSALPAGNILVNKSKKESYKCLGVCIL